MCHVPRPYYTVFHAVHPLSPSSYLVLDQVPSSQQLSHVHELNDDPRTAPSASLSSQQPLTFQPVDKASSPLYVGGGLPPVPAKLAKRVQNGQFIEIGELLPEVLRGPSPYDDDHQKSLKSKYQELNDIVDWIQCFSLYI